MLESVSSPERSPDKRINSLYVIMYSTYIKCITFPHPVTLSYLVLSCLLPKAAKNHF